MPPSTDRPRPPRLLAAILLVLACARTEPHGSRADGKTIVQGPIGERVHEYLRRAARFGFSGAVLVAKDGEIVLQAGYGFADRERGTPVTANTVFSIGSITKQFTAAAIVSLEEAKRLSTRDSIGKFFPTVPPDKAGMTVHHLLTHTAGLPGALGGDFERIARDSLVRLALATALLWPPGTRYEYSNVGYTLLAAIIEYVSGSSYEEYLRRSLFVPAGLTETGYGLPWGAERMAVGYDDTTRWGTSVERWQPDGPWWHVIGNGELHSTVADLHRWVEALDSGRVLGRESRAKLVTPYVPEDPSGESRYGYGWVVQSTPWGTPLIWHNGGNGVFYADLRRFPEDRLVLVFLTNADVNATLHRDLVRVVFGHPAPVIPDALDSLGVAELEAYPGRYLLPSGAALEVRTEHGRLVALGDPEAGMTFVPLAAPGAGGLAAEQDGKRILESLGRDDFGPLLAYLSPARDEATFLVGEWRRWLGEWRSELGPFRTARLLGSRAVEGDRLARLELYAVLRFSRGARLVRLSERKGETGLREFSRLAYGARLPVRIVLAPTGTDAFATYLPGFGAAQRIRFEREAGAIAALVAESPGGPVRARRVSSRPD